MSYRLDVYTGQQPQRDTLVNINSTTSYPPPQWPKKPSHALPRRLSPLPPANQFVHPHLLSTLFLPHTHSLSIHRTNTQQTDAQGQLTAAVDDLLDQLQHKFDNVSRDMFGKRQLSPLHCSSILVGPIHNASKKNTETPPRIYILLPFLSLFFPWYLTNSHSGRHGPETRRAGGLVNHRGGYGVAWGGESEKVNG